MSRNAVLKTPDGGLGNPNGDVTALLVTPEGGSSSLSLGAHIARLYNDYFTPRTTTELMAALAAGQTRISLKPGATYILPTAITMPAGTGEVVIKGNGARPLVPKESRNSVFSINGTWGAPASVVAVGSNYVDVADATLFADGKVVRLYSEQPLPSGAGATWRLGENLYIESINLSINRIFFRKGLIYSYDVAQNVRISLIDTRKIIIENLIFPLDPGGDALAGWGDMVSLSSLLFPELHGFEFEHACGNAILLTSCHGARIDMDNRPFFLAADATGADQDAGADVDGSTNRSSGVCLVRSENCDVSGLNTRNGHHGCFSHNYGVVTPASPGDYGHSAHHSVHDNRFNGTDWACLDTHHGTFNVEYRDNISIGCGGPPQLRGVGHRVVNHRSERDQGGYRAFVQSSYIGLAPTSDNRFINCDWFDPAAGSYFWSRTGVLRTTIVGGVARASHDAGVSTPIYYSNGGELTVTGGHRCEFSGNAASVVKAGAQSVAFTDSFIDLSNASGMAGKPFWIDAAAGLRDIRHLEIKGPTAGALSYLLSGNGTTWPLPFAGSRLGNITINSLLTGMVRGRTLTDVRYLLSGELYVEDQLRAWSPMAMSTDDVTTITAATYTLVDADHQRVIAVNRATAVVVTLPAVAKVGFATVLIQIGAGQATVSPASGATLRNFEGHSKTAAQDAVVGLKVTANDDGNSAVWHLFGATAA